MNFTSPQSKSQYEYPRKNRNSSSFNLTLLSDKLVEAMIC
jgi:hypothetical protein